MKTKIDTSTVKLVGLDRLRAKWGLTQSDIYGKNRRGKLGEPDWRVARTPKRPKGVGVWLAERFGDEPGDVDTTPYEGELPPLVGMEEIAAALDIQRHSVEIIRSRGRQDISAPEPYDTIGQTPVWWIDPWVDFARATRRPIYLDRLAEHHQRMDQAST